MAETQRSDVATVSVNKGAALLPDGDFVANAAFHREGADLFLTSPEGHSVKVADYFTHTPPPLLETPDGAQLSPEMVDAFLPPQHAGQYAAATSTSSDATPAGKISELVGEAHVVRADGTRVEAKAGMAVFPGDVIETAADGAVNLVFADNTTFAISESARLSVDQFVYNASEQTGSSFFSMLQGVFVYTSGLIGKSDPSAVNIETPVGSIGIRGTVVAGEIAPAGKESKITIVDGAVVVSNSAGTMELSDSFQTASLSSHRQPPADAGRMSADTFTSIYHSVSSVAGDTFNHLGSLTPPASDTPANPQNNGTEAPAHTAPQGETPTPSSTQEGQLQQAPAPVQAAEAPMVTPPAQPPAPSSFNASAADGDSGATTFSRAVISQIAQSNPGLAAAIIRNVTADITPTPGSIYAANNTTAPAIPQLGFRFSNWYDNPTTNADTPGLPLFMQGVAGSAYVVGHIVSANMPAGTTFTLTGNMMGQSIEYNIVTTGNPYDTRQTQRTDMFSFDAGTGELVLNDASFAASFANNAHVFTITAVGPGGGVIRQDSFSVLFKDFYPASMNVLIGDHPASAGDKDLFGNSVATNDTIIGDMNAPDFIMGRDGNDTLEGKGGADALLGGNGADSLRVGDATFLKVDGGAHNDTLILGDIYHAPMTFNLVQQETLASGVIRNIETIELGRSNAAAGNSIRLGIADVFAMTDPSEHTLTIKASSVGGTTGSTVTIADATGMGFRQSGTLVDADSNGETMTLTGTYKGATVTLVIEHDNTTTGNHITVT
jgi:hypothetical protein